MSNFALFVRGDMIGATSCGAALGPGGYDVVASSVNYTSGDGGTQLGGTPDTAPGISRRVSLVGLAATPDRKLVSATGRDIQSTACVLPVRGHLDSIKRLMKGDLYIGVVVDREA